jgi:hypothetical protein
MAAAYFVTDAYGRTIERVDADSIEAARSAARMVDCPSGVWLCPSVWSDDDGGYVGIGADEEIYPATWPPPD